jgi:hypothetical protein
MQKSNPHIIYTSLHICGYFKDSQHRRRIKQIICHFKLRVTPGDLNIEYKEVDNMVLRRPFEPICKIWQEKTS